jgi:hypothetical protein
MLKMDERKKLCPSLPDKHKQRERCFLGLYRQLPQHASSKFEASPVHFYAHSAFGMCAGPLVYIYVPPGISVAAKAL